MEITYRASNWQVDINSALCHCLVQANCTALVISGFSQSCMMSFKWVSKSTSFSCSLPETRPDTRCRVDTPPSNCLENVSQIGPTPSSAQYNDVTHPSSHSCFFQAFPSCAGWYAYRGNNIIMALTTICDSRGGPLEVYHHWSIQNSSCEPVHCKMYAKNIFQRGCAIICNTDNWIETHSLSRKHICQVCHQVFGPFHKFPTDQPSHQMGNLYTNLQVWMYGHIHSSSSVTRHGVYCLQP